MFLILLSFLLLSLAQPDLSVVCSMLAASVGFALFWKGLLSFESKKKRFLISFIWFFAISALHLSWLASDRYVGAFIYLLLLFVSISMGLFFATFSLFVKQELSFLRIASLASVWTIFEWSKLFFLCGFSFDPLGLNLTATLYGLQAATIGGVFGLTFWIVFCNLLTLKALHSNTRTRLVWIFCLVLPYLYGWAHFHTHKSALEKSPTLSALLLQPSLSPEEKFLFPFSEKPPLTPLEQWKGLLHLAHQYRDEKIDLILFPEAVVPYGTHRLIYPSQQFVEAFGHYFTPPAGQEKNVGNGAFAQALSNHFGAPVVIGLEEFDSGKAYNAAVVFHPNQERQERYYKRVLVPMGEYIPFEWCKKILAKYGIQDSFTKGTSAKVFQGKVPFGISICYEETYGHLMRQNRLLGAECLLNMTNDVWYPYSRLPIFHFMHAKLRTVEQGIPLLRSTNTGVTCGVDSLGQVCAMLPYESAKNKAPASSLLVKVPTYTYKTLYTLTGDWGIISVCITILFTDLIIRARARVRAHITRARLPVAGGAAVLSEDMLACRGPDSPLPPPGSGSHTGSGSKK